MLVDDEFLPRDDLSEAMYTSVKLDALYKNATEAPEDIEMAPSETEQELEQEQEQESPSNSREFNTTENSKNASLQSTALVTQTKRPESSAHSPWTLRKVLAGAHQGWVRSVAIDPVTNAWFATGSADAQIKVWDLASGSVKASLPGHILGVRALAVSHRHPYLFSGAEDKTVRCWDLERSNSPAGCQIRDYHGHVGGVYALAIHPELDLLFSAGRDSAIRVWDIRSRTQVMVLTGHRNDVTSLVTQTGDPQVCSASMDSTVKLWDLRMQKAQLTLTHHTKSVRSMALHPHESTLVSADSSGSIKQWVLPAGQLLNAFSADCKSKTGSAFGVGSGSRDPCIINSVCINPATNELFTGSNDGRMHFYDYVSGELVQETATVPSSGTDSSIIYASAFDMSGSRLLTCENDKSIKIWGNDIF